MGGILIVPDIPKPRNKELTNDQIAMVDGIVRHLMDLANSGADMERTIAGWDEEKPANAADVDDDDVTAPWSRVYLTIAVRFDKTEAGLH
jgi:hypothetical protein